MDLPILVDVAIGLSVVYLVASLFVTIANEYIAQLLKLRGKQLAKNLQALILDHLKDDTVIVNALKQSPALKPFFSDGKASERASYVDPSVLAHLLVGAVAAGQTGAPTMAQTITAIGEMKDSAVKTALSALARSVSDDVDTFVQKVGVWADQSLTMLGEAYKKEMQIVSLALGLLVAGAFNLDTIAITDFLYRDKDAREATAAVAADLVEKTSAEVFQKCSSLAEEARRKDASCAAVASLIDGLKLRQGAFGKLPIGWGLPADSGAGAGAWALRVVGWLLTALAVSLGASFWFDLLKRLVNIRHGMRRPETAPAPAK